MSVHQCPDCELRFLSESDLRDHLDSDHPGAEGERFPRPRTGGDRPGGPK